MIKFKAEPHSFNRKLKSIPWMVCSRCGMIRLKNQFSDWCVQNGCNHDEHPNYQSERQKASAVH